MVTCNVCYFWQPKQWEGWRFTDTIAFCPKKNRHITANETCESATITKPKDIVIKKSTVTKEAVKEIDVFTGELYAHQKEAVEFFDKLNEIALFFEMGTGKSATVLEIASRKRERAEIDQLLIIAPNGVHVQWYKEQLPLWLRMPYDVQCLYGRGGARQSYPFDDDKETLKVIIVNVDTFSTPSKWQDIADWVLNGRTMVILDEATCIKNLNAQRTQHILYGFNDVIRKGKTVLKSTPKTICRAILTGTPVTNGPMDLWSMMEFLRPNFFGRNFYSFQNHFGMFTRMAVEDKQGNIREIQVPLTEEWWKSIKAITSYDEARVVCGCSEDTFNTVHSQERYEGPYKHAEELKEALKPVAQFKMLRDCMDMPEQTYIQKKVLMSDEQRRCYDEMVDEYITTYETHTATALNKLSVLIRLQQISSGFLCDKTLLQDETIDDNRVNTLYDIVNEKDILPNEIKWIGTSVPKLDMLYDDVATAARPCIIVTRFTAEADRIYNDLRGKYSCCLITGWKRVGTIEEFKEGKYQVMVANIAAIAYGYNLQNSYCMFIYTNTFSLEQRLQLEGRIFRVGQKRACIYNDYIHENSVDEKIVGALLLKRNLLDYVRGADIKEVVG